MTDFTLQSDVTIGRKSYRNRLDPASGKRRFLHFKAHQVIEQSLVFPENINRFQAAANFLLPSLHEASQSKRDCFLIAHA